MAKEVKATKRYVSPDNTEGKQSFYDGAAVLEFRFANGETVTVNPDNFSELVRTAAMFHGISQKLGDAYASSKDADEAYDKFMALYERLEAGEWLAERESAGPRMTQVIEAIIAAMREAGQSVDEDEVKKTYHAMDKERQKAVLKDPRIDAQYQAIRAKAAADRAARAAEKAKEAGGAIVL